MCESSTTATSWAGFGLCFERSSLKQKLSVPTEHQALNALKHMVRDRDHTLSVYGSKDFILISNCADYTALNMTYPTCVPSTTCCPCTLVYQDLGFTPMTLQRLCRLLKLEDDAIGHWSMFMLEPGFLSFETIYEGWSRPLWPSRRLSMSPLIIRNYDEEESDAAPPFPPASKKQCVGSLATVEASVAAPNLKRTTSFCL